MQAFIARENIRRFQAQLEACTDPQQRNTLERLLEQEKKRLNEALAENPGDRSSALGGRS
jgi:rubrerythrin